MKNFLIALRFALNVYIIATFITLLVLGIVNTIKKVTRKG